MQLDRPPFVLASRRGWLCPGSPDSGPNEHPAGRGETRLSALSTPVRVDAAAGHPAVATHTETWAALPLVYQLRSSGVRSEYSHRLARVALLDVIESLPHGHEDFREAVRKYLLHLYQQLSPPGVTYFLDKTPRYSLITDELRKLFPAAPLIVLWRNPLAVLASSVRTWHDGRWRLANVWIELTEGLDRLLLLARTAPPNALFLRFEDLLLDPQSTLERVFSHLQVDPSASNVSSLRDVRLTGRHGDHTGTERYSRVSLEPLRGWVQEYNTPFRRSFARRYLHRVGAENLRLMGYDMDELYEDIAHLSSNYLMSLRDFVQWNWDSLGAGLDVKWWVRRRLFDTAIRRDRMYPLG